MKLTTFAKHEQKPGTCKTCQLDKPTRIEVDRALASGEGSGVISRWLATDKQVTIDSSSIRRHRAKHLKPKGTR